MLIALVVLVPLLAAAGFVRMAAELRALPPVPPASPELVTARVALAGWADDLMKGYLGVIAVAFLIGRLRALALRRSA